VAELGIYNSLAQTLIKITAPGVPDFYQGTELWDLTLVDPDNRRPVDYDTRRGALESLTSQVSSLPDRSSSLEPSDFSLTDLLTNRADGRIKLFVIAKALGARA